MRKNVFTIVVITAPLIVDYEEEDSSYPYHTQAQDLFFARCFDTKIIDMLTN